MFYGYELDLGHKDSSSNSPRSQSFRGLSVENANSPTLRFGEHDDTLGVISKQSSFATKKGDEDFALRVINANQQNALSKQNSIDPGMGE